MQTQNRIRPVPHNHTEGMMAVAWGCMGITSVIHAMTNTGISSFMGWVALVSACLLFYSNSVSWFSQGRERLLKQQTSFVGQVLLVVVVAVQITDAAGVWDAR